ncbi:MAG: Beta-barrel assembly-enhancing protease [Phycisphaerae bacterium]|nr:Beta-barrel assembly-enhancing protease [Phycisphaerae bacterium]
MPRCHPLIAGLALLILTGLAYLPVGRAGFIWDDDHYVTENRTLHSLDGLRRIWLEPRAIPQYYPLVHTSFWVEYQLWGLRPLGYHAVNVALHALSAVLLWRLLRALAVPAAWFTAAVFAVHPVCVESVAWVTERKNVLSLCFYLAAGLCILRALPAQRAVDVPSDAAPPRPYVRHWYALALLAFLAAMWSKTVACTWPAAALVVLWARGGSLRLRDVALMLPFLAIGVALGLHTVALEREQVGALGPEWNFSTADRCLIAGRAVWFYAFKLIWPANLMFIYPRWQIDDADARQYVYPAALLGLLVALWLLRRRIGRWPLAATLVFTGTLFPALGFFNVFPMKFSFVADHFQYHAAIALLALFAATAARQLEHYHAPRAVTIAAGAAVIAALAATTFRQAGVYRDSDSVWRDCIARNPTAWMPRANLGYDLFKRGDLAAATPLLEEAARMRPTDSRQLVNLANAYIESGRLPDAYRVLLDALNANSTDPEVHYSLGVYFSRANEPDKAISRFTDAIRGNPEYAQAHANLAAILLTRGQAGDALPHLQHAITLRPDLYEPRYQLGVACLMLQRLDEATAHLTQAAQMRPENVIGRIVLAGALESAGKPAAALDELRACVRLHPDSVETLTRLAWLLSTCPEDALRRGDEALQHARRAVQLAAATDPRPLDALAAAQAELRQFDQAVATVQQALALAQQHGDTALADQIAARLALYRASQPFRTNRPAP